MKQGKIEFIKFSIVGAISFIFHNIVYLLLIEFGINDTIAYSAGYCTWAVSNFLLSSYYTFHTQPTLKRALGFAASATIYYLIQLVGFSICQWIGLPDIVITPLVYTFAFPFNFVMVRLVLKERKKEPSI